MNNVTLRDSVDRDALSAADDMSAASGRSILISDLYVHYRTMLRRFLMSRFSRFLSKEEVEDLAQDAYLALCQVEELQVIKNPRAYLIKTATNLAIDFGRRSQVRSLAQADLQRIEDRPSTPEKIAGDRQDLRILYQCILDLPVRCRQVFLLHRYHGWSHQRISNYLGISVHAVEKHIVRALKRCDASLRVGALPP
jgi:RNA polymerase sigma factor (sigma-70 family)